MQKRRVGLFVWIVLMMLFSLAFALTADQSFESAGTVTLNGCTVPVYRVRLSLTQVNRGILQIEMKEPAKEYLRFVDYSMVGMSGDNDQILFDANGTSCSVRASMSGGASSSFSAFVTRVIPETGFFTCYIAPKSREAYETLLLPEYQCGLQVTLGVGGVETAGSLLLSVPRVRLELLNANEELTDGSLSRLSYSLFVNEQQETVSNGQMLWVTCNLNNQVLDYESVTVPDAVSWCIKGEDLCFLVPNQTRTEIRFDTIPCFADAVVNMASTGVVSLTASAAGSADAVRKTVKYKRIYAERYEYVDILAVSDSNYRVPVRNALFRLRSLGNNPVVPEGAVLITTDENGSARLIGDEEYGMSTWHLLKDEPYELAEVAAPDGYFPLGSPVTFKMTDTYDPSAGEYRSGDVLLITYREGVSWGIAGSYSLTGREMRADEIRRLTLVPSNDAAKDSERVQMPENCTVDIGQASGQFAFENVRTFAPGEYEFEIQQEDLSAVGIVHEADKIYETITVSRNEDTGVLQVSGMHIRKQSGSEQTKADTLTVQDSYEPSGEYTIQGVVTVDGAQPGLETFQIELLQGDSVVETVTSAADGTFTFGPILFTSEKADVPVQYTITPAQPTAFQTGNGLYLQTQSSSLTLTAQDDGNGRMIVSASEEIPVRIEYAHERTLTIHYRVHQCPPSKADLRQKLIVSVNAELSIPMRIQDGESENTVYGSAQNGSTVYTCEIRGGAVLTIPDIPIQTDFRIAFPDDPDGTVGFTYRGQTYQTAEMNGRIGACIPVYEALMIYPYGEYTPEVKLHSLAEQDMSGLTFSIAPADDETQAALRDGWIGFSCGEETVSGIAETVSATDGVIRFYSNGGVPVHFSVYKTGQYAFETAVSTADREAIGFQNETVRIDLAAEGIQTDVLSVSQQGAMPEIVCYPLKELNISVLESTLADKHSLRITVDHPKLDLAQYDVQMVCNGEASACRFSGNTAEFQMAAGDEITLLLPHGTVFSIEAEDDLPTVLMAVDGASPVTDRELLSQEAVRYELKRRSAGITLTVHQNMDEQMAGRVRFRFYESENADVPVSGLPLTILVNGQSKTMSDECLTVTDGDTVSLSGQLSGIWCEIESMEPSAAIHRISVNDGPFTDSDTAKLHISSGENARIALVQSVLTATVTGTVNVLGEALDAGCFEVCIEAMNEQAAETIPCPASEDGQYAFAGAKRQLTGAGTSSYRVTQKPVKSMPMMIVDATVYVVDYTVSYLENGTAAVQQSVSEVDGSGQKQARDAIRFTNIRLFPLQINSQTVEKDRPMSYQLNVRNAGQQTKFVYTIGTKSGQIVSGEVLTLFNEQATIWLPFGSAYEIRPVPAAGFMILPDEGETLSGVIGQAVQIHLTAQYEPETVMGDAGTAVSGTVVLENGQWSDEVFKFFLQPADDETLSASGKGFRFIGGNEGILYQASSDAPSFAVSLAVPGNPSGKGLEALQAGRYVFTLTQLDVQLAGVQLDDHEAELILTVTDDDNGHLFPSLQLSEHENSDGIVFRNKALASLTIASAVTARTDSVIIERGYEKRKMPFRIDIPAIGNEDVSASFVRSEGMESQTLQAVDGIIGIELAHGESVTLHDLPAGIPYTVRPEPTVGYLAEQQMAEGTLIYRSTERADFQFVYSPSGQIVVTGHVQLLYRAAKPRETAVFVLTPSDDVTREAFGETFRLETTVILDEVQPRGEPVSGQRFAFDPLEFNQVGVYTFELCQASEHLPNTIYDETKYQVRITVSESESGSGQLQARSEVLLEGQLASASFVNRYEASGQSVISGYLKPLERQVKVGEFEFELLDENGKILGEAALQEDGTFAFDPVLFTAADIGQVRYYLVRQKIGIALGVEYDRQEFRVITAVRDDGNGSLTVNMAYSKKDAAGAWTNADRILFGNHYSADGSLNVGGEIRILGRSFLLGEVFTIRLFQENDACEWLEVDAVSIEPKGKQQETVELDALEFTLSDVADSPIYYKLQIDGPFTSLIQVEGMDEIQFSVELTDNGDGHLSVNTSLEEEPEFLMMSYTEMAIECEFDDLQNQEALRPNSLAVRILANGEELDRLILSQDNGWSTTTGLLPMADDEGRNIRYTLDPVSAKPYGLTLNDDGVNAYRLTARYRPHIKTTGEILSRLLSDAPETGDHERIEIYIGVFVGAVVILILFFFRTRKRKR